MTTVQPTIVVLAADRATTPLSTGVDFPIRAVVAATRGSSPSVLLTIEVDNGKPVVRQVTLGSPEQKVALTSSDLASVPLNAISDVAVKTIASVAWTRGLLATGDMGLVSDAFYQFAGIQPKSEAADSHDATVAAAASSRTRRFIDEALLGAVAQLVRKNPETPNKAVAQALHTSPRNASRWISAARRAGFLQTD